MSAADRDVFRRVRESLAKALDLPVQSLPDDASQGSVEKWDSLGHLNVIMELEAEFGVTLTTDEAIALKSVSEMVWTVKRHLHGD